MKKLILISICFSTIVVNAQMTGGGVSSQYKSSNNGSLQDYYGNILKCYDVFQSGAGGTDNLYGPYLAQSFSLLKVFKYALAMGGGIGIQYSPIIHNNLKEVFSFLSMPVYFNTRFFPTKKIYIDTKLGICPVLVGVKSMVIGHGGLGFGYSTNKISLGIEYQANLLHYGGIRIGIYL